MELKSKFDIGHNIIFIDRTSDSWKINNGTITNISIIQLADNTYQFRYTISLGNLSTVLIDEWHIYSSYDEFKQAFIRACEDCVLKLGVKHSYEHPIVRTYMFND
jgi:hypothetical protein